MSESGVSVVIPAYNAARLIGRAIESVLSQTHRPLEILVIDDGSREPMEQSLAAYQGVVTCIRKPNGGAASARNLGIDRARGDFIAFLDADDYWEPTKLARQIEIFRQYPEVGLVASRYSEREPGSLQQHPLTRGQDLIDRRLTPSGADLFETAMLVMTSTVVLRRWAVGNLRFVSGLEPAEDRDLWIRLIHVNPAYIIGDSRVSVILEPGSLSRSDPDQGYASMLEVLHRHSRLLSSRELRHFEARVFRGWASSHLGRAQGRSALHPALRRLVRQPWSLEALYVVLKAVSLSLLN